MYKLLTEALYKAQGKHLIVHAGEVVPPLIAQGHISLKHILIDRDENKNDNI